MKNKNSRQGITFHLVLGALTAAFYVILTIFSAFFGLAYGSIQFRIAEALCILPAFFPSAIAGLTVGCIVSNFFSPIMIIDVIFGSLATLIAAVCGWLLRKVTVKGVPVLVPLPAVLVNAVIVGLEVSLFMEGAAGFWITAAEVGLGQLVCCYGLGLPLYMALKRLGFDKFIDKYSKWGGNAE